MKVKICPKCGLKGEIILVLGGSMGSIYKCKKCGFTSSIFPEIDTKNETKKNQRKEEARKKENENLS